MATRSAVLHAGETMMVQSDSTTPNPPGTGTWENEGGALASPGSPVLPDGVIAIPVTHYRVGQYTYTNIDDAMAQYRRQSSK